MTLRFGLGDRVRVCATGTAGHKRTPTYVRGKVGTIERFCGEFRNPEALAYGDNGLPRRQLFRVHFQQRDIWPDYAGSRHDTLEVEVYEHWLERI